MTPTLVSLHGVAVRAGALTILRDVDLELSEGESLGLFGANGAGKTTLLRLVATLIRPDSGSATVLGVDATGSARLGIRRRIGYIGHVPGLYPELTLAENLRFAADIAGVDVAEVDVALAAVGLSEAAGRQAGDTSHGMQRRTEFAREIMRRPDLLLLDEPHAALDQDSSDLVSSLVADTLSRGGAAILVSHDRDRVAAAVDRTVEIKSGTVV